MKVVTVFKIRFYFVFIILFMPFALFAKPFALFSSKDDITAKLVEKIDNSKSQIHVAVYFLTDSKIAEALIRAKKRNINVEVVMDSSCTDDKCGKVTQLKKAGVPVYLYYPANNKTLFSNPIMHNKFAVFDEKLLWTGSFNWTVSANKKNKENVVCVDDEQVCQDYEKQFKYLKSICSTKYSKNNDERAREKLQKLFEIIKNKLALNENENKNEKDKNLKTKRNLKTKKA